MRKLLVATAVLLCVLLTAGIAAASPLADHSAGKMSLDLNWTPNLSLSGVGGSGTSFDGKTSNLDFGLTAGLGHRWAIQYRNFSPESGNYGGIYYGLKTQEANLLYRFEPHLAAFVGWHQARLSGNVPGSSLPTKNTCQVGLIGNTEIAPKTVLYGIVGAGGNLFTGEAGISYALQKDLEFTVFYRYKRVDNLQLDGVSTDVTAKGIGVGLTYKF